MRTYEYRCLRVTQDRVIENEGRALVDALDELGAEGWELASMCAEQGQAGNYLVVLQRTVGGESDSPRRGGLDSM